MTDKATSLQPTERLSATQAPLKVVDPLTMAERMNQINEDISRRAFELFMDGGGVFGHELDHWFHAESELLHPAHVSVTESEKALVVRAEVPGFTANELQVSLEPRRLTISGKKESTRESDERKTVYQERCSSEVLRVVELPSEINASKTTAVLKNGVLELNLPKVVESKATPVLVKSATNAA